MLVKLARNFVKMPKTNSCKYIIDPCNNDIVCCEDLLFVETNRTHFKVDFIKHHHVTCTADHAKANITAANIEIKIFFLASLS